MTRELEPVVAGVELLKTVVASSGVLLKAVVTGVMMLETVVVTGAVLLEAVVTGAVMLEAVETAIRGMQVEAVATGAVY